MIIEATCAEISAVLKKKQLPGGTEVTLTGADSGKLKVRIEKKVFFAPVKFTLTLKNIHVEGGKIGAEVEKIPDLLASALGDYIKGLEMRKGALYYPIPAQLRELGTIEEIHPDNNKITVKISIK